MAICRNPNCEKENPDDLLFCKYCGRRLKEPADHSKVPYKILTVLAGMIVLLIAVKVMFSFGGNNEQNIAKNNKNNNQVIKDDKDDNETKDVVDYKFAFVRGQDSYNEIYVHNRDGSVIKLTDSNAMNSYPSFSHNGKKIVFQRKQDDNTNIYVMNSDGTNARKLSEGFRPTWGPDDSKIIFYKDDPDSISNILYSININGTNLDKLTNTNDSYFMARYSPDGSRVAITKYSIAGWGIYTVRPDLSGRKPLAISEERLGNPSWSPKGNEVVFQNEKDGDFEIYTVDLNKNVSKLTNNQLTDSNPCFTSDNKIIFTRQESGQPNLYIMNSDGTNQKLILNNAAYASVINK